MGKSNKKKKKKKLILWISIAISILAAVSIAAVVLLTKKSYPTLLEMSVSAYKVETEETKLFTNEFSFSQLNFDAPQNTTAINESISPDRYIKMVYDIKNKDQSQYFYQLDFSTIDMDNVNIIYSINSGAEQALIGDKIVTSVSEDISVTILLKVNNPAQDSHFIGYINMFVQNA